MTVAPIIDLKKTAQGENGKAVNRFAEISEKATAPKIITWQAPEFAVHGKSFRWYAALFAATGLLVLVSALLKNYTAAALFMLAAAVVYVFAQKSPRVLVFAVDARGVRIDGRLYAYDALRSFWIFYDPPGKTEVSFRSRSMLMPYIRVPLGSTNPAQLHRLLTRFLPETKHAESVADSLSERAGF